MAALALAHIQDGAQLKQKLKELHLKAESHHNGDEVKDAAATAPTNGHGPSHDEPMPEERWNPHWQSNLKLLQVNEGWGIAIHRR